jgi:hypothetical protein
VLALPAEDFDLLVRYYGEEPWGAWRDNLHAAIIAREVRAGRAKGRINLDDFMVVDKRRKAQANMGKFVEALRAMAGGKSVKSSELKKARGARGRPGKAGSTPGSAVRATAHRARQGKPKTR